MRTKTATEGQRPSAAAGPAVTSAAATRDLRPARLESHTSVTRRSLGLGTRFSLATAILLLVTLGALLLVVNAHANRVARESIRGDLSRAPAIIGAYQADLQARAGNQVRSIAGEPGTKAIFDPGCLAGDASRVRARHRPRARRDAHRLPVRRRRAACSRAAIARKATGWARISAACAGSAEPLESWREAAAVIREGKDLSVVAAAPVISGSGDMARLDGVLAASFPFSQAHATALQGLTRGEVALLVDAARRGEAPRPTLSTATSGSGGEALVGAFAALPGAAEAVLRRGQPYGPFELVVENARRICLAVPIIGSSGEAYGALLVSRTLAAETAAFDRIRRTLFLVGAVALVARGTRVVPARPPAVAPAQLSSPKAPPRSATAT